MGPQGLDFSWYHFALVLEIFSQGVQKLEISLQTRNGDGAGITKPHLQKQHFVASPIGFIIQTIFYSRELFLSPKCDKDYVSKQKGFIFQWAPVLKTCMQTLS